MRGASGCRRSRAGKAALRTRTPSMAHQRRLLSASDSPDWIFDALAGVPHWQCPFAPRHPRFFGAAVPPRVRIGRFRPGFFSPDDRTRTSLHLVRRGGRLRGRSTIALEPGFYDSPGTPPGPKYVSTSKTAFPQPAEIDCCGSGVCSGSSRPISSRSSPLHEILGKAGRSCWPSPRLCRPQSSDGTPNVTNNHYRLGTMDHRLLTSDLCLYSLPSEPCPMPRQLAILVYTRFAI